MKDRSELYYLLQDALKEFYTRREPVFEYVENRYAEHSDSFRISKIEGVQRRVELAHLLCTKLDDIVDAVEKILDRPVVEVKS